MFNSLGKILQLHTFGESHGPAIGGIIDGFPSGVVISTEQVQNALDKRKPGQSHITTARKESDSVSFLSGIFEGISSGHPIGFQIQNTNSKSKDYDHIKEVFRPSHADWAYQQKYGIRDYRGGGRSSARETANWVVAGALAKQLIPKVQISAFVSQVGKISLHKIYKELDLSTIEDTIVRCPDAETAQKMIAEIEKVKKQGDSIGGIITCVAQNVPAAWGEPIFHKLHAQLGHAMLSINAVKGFEYGSGFEGVSLKGSEHNDNWNEDGTTQTNHSGGIQGGISNGMDIYFRVAFKPVATLLQEHKALNTSGEIIDSHGRGRHDPCVLPRAVPIVEALTAWVLADAFLMNKVRKV